MAKIKLKDRLTKFFSKKELKGKNERADSSISQIKAEAPPRR